MGSVSLDRLAAFAEFTDQCVTITDSAGVIRYVNKAFERATGYSAAEAIGQTPRLLRSGRHGAAFYASLWQALNQGERWSGRATNRKKDGSLFDWDMLIIPVHGEGGAVLGFVAAARVMAGHGDAEDRLRQREKMETLGRLAGSISHDFGSLTASILLNTDALLTRLEARHPFRFELEMIRDAARRASALSGRLLAFGRRQALHPRLIDLNAIIHRTCEILSCAVARTVTVDLHLDPALGASLADPTQIEQVVMNLALNARDAMPQGGTLTIATDNVDLAEGDLPGGAELAPGAYVVLTVTDTGVGMDAETIARLFEPFFTTKEPGKGTGLGLSTVYGIVKQSGGQLAVASRPGRGTTFSVYLPRVTAPASPRDGAEDAALRQQEFVLAVRDARG